MSTIRTLRRCWSPNMPTNHGTDPNEELLNTDPTADSKAAGYEMTDVNASGIVVFPGGLFGFVIVFFFFCFLLGRVINGELEREDGKTDKWHQQNTIFAGALANNGNQSTSDLHAREDLLLNHYSSVPGEPLRIPIDRAMELIAAKGLPVAASSQPTTKLAGDAEPVV